MELIQVALSIPMYQYIEAAQYTSAYALACLGVTSDDWKLLALVAAENLAFDVALKCFRKLQWLRHIDLISAFLVTLFPASFFPFFLQFSVFTKSV